MLEVVIPKGIPELGLPEDIGEQLQHKDRKVEELHITEAFSMMVKLRMEEELHNGVELPRKEQVGRHKVVD